MPSAAYYSLTPIFVCISSHYSFIRDLYLLQSCFFHGELASKKEFLSSFEFSTPLLTAFINPHTSLSSSILENVTLAISTSSFPRVAHWNYACQYLSIAKSEDAFKIVLLVLWRTWFCFLFFGIFCGFHSASLCCPLCLYGFSIPCSVTFQNTYSSAYAWNISTP